MCSVRDYVDYIHESVNATRLFNFPCTLCKLIAAAYTEPDFLSRITVFWHTSQISAPVGIDRPPRVDPRGFGARPFQDKVFAAQVLSVVKA